MPELIAKSADAKIKRGSSVTLHFSLLLPTGEEIDTTRNGKPAQLILGDGNLLPGFEDAILGLHAGDAEQITLPADEAFGEHNAANVQVLPKTRFHGMAGEQALEPGLVVSFKSPDGELPGVIREVYSDTIKVDFNHPLSGSAIVFDVSILKVENAS